MTWIRASVTWGVTSPLPHPSVRQTVQRDHPVNNILGAIEKGVTTRSCVTTFLNITHLFPLLNPSNHYFSTHVKIKRSISGHGCFDGYSLVHEKLLKNIMSILYLAKKGPKIKATCDELEMTKMMCFKYSWNKEIIFQFHATLYFDADGQRLLWMTDGQQCVITGREFARMLGLEH
jgi:hypothetical protein